MSVYMCVWIPAGCVGALCFFLFFLNYLILFLRLFVSARAVTTLFLIKNAQYFYFKDEKP